MEQVVSVSPARARAAVVLVAVAVATGVVAHGTAALHEPAGWMAWWMGVMAALCLACALPMVGKHRCAGRGAGHVMAMSAVMVLVHASVMLLPGAGLHHATGTASAHASHSAPMLLLIAVELLCMMSASVALRLNRPVRITSRQEYP